MRYSFQKSQVGEFEIYRSEQVMGDVHLKRFLPGVTPQNQATLNVYIDGSFRMVAGGYSQVFSAGSTSLDTALSSYPGGAVFTESVLSATGLRYCVSRLGGGPWLRERLAVSGPTVFDEDSVLIVLSGVIDGFGAGCILRISAGQPVQGGARVVRCWVEPVS